jgi:hypothetical protein
MPATSVAFLLAMIAAGLGSPMALAQHARSPAQTAQDNPEPRRPTVCTEQYAPVCGRLNKVEKTYSNQCYARAAGAEVIAQGPCSSSSAPHSPR